MSRTLTLRAEQDRNRGRAMQQAKARIEVALHAAVARGEQRGAPPRLAAAIRHAVWPGGARIRPLLCLAVSAACGDGDPPLTDAAAAGIELLHCASLVHDDLPCFDDATTRRGQPSVHVAHGERCAVLAGDALIVTAFETLAHGAIHNALRLPRMLAVLAQRVGMPNGIVAGQAWECEDWAALPDYHRAKTGSLFAAATELGALAAGGDPTVWRAFGEWLGEAYQVADDIRDAACEDETLGKPAHKDRTLGRPSAVHEFGLPGALAHFERLVDRAGQSVPPGPGARALRALLHAEAERLLPPTVRAQAVA
jgi:geranylgeranyl diphosphate synthase, type II